MFARHLPPSADRPRVLALDERAAAELPTEIHLTTPPQSGVFDAVVGSTINLKGKIIIFRIFR